MTDEKEIKQAPVGDHTVGVQDELGKEIEGMGIENLERDVSIMVTNLENLNKELDNYVAQWDVDKEVYELMSVPGALRKVEASINVELQDRYWELKEKQFAYKMRMDFHQAESYIANKKSQIEIAEEKLAGAQERLETFQKEE